MNTTDLYTLEEASLMSLFNSSQPGENFNDTENISESSFENLDHLLEDSRFVVQRILIPFMMVVGIIGNGITVSVLTRRNMHSSTNCYLTALAVSDLLFLVFMFSLSLRHIAGMSHKQHWVYWQYFRYALWLTDASGSTSIWLTVMFTIERYIAVCHPMKGKVFCTQSRAKRLIVSVYISCFALTVTTPYEWVVVPDPRDNGTSLILDESPLGKNGTYRKTFYWFSAVTFILLPLTLLAIFNSFLIAAVKDSRAIRRQMTQRQTICRETQSTQENKITIMLIAVVVVALLCQLPTAIMLMYTSFKQIQINTTEYYLTRIFGNIFNFLTSVNAASNFILYCVMSDRFRKTFLKTFCSSKWSTAPSRTGSFYCTSTDGISLQTSVRNSHSRLSWNNSSARKQIHKSVYKTHGIRGDIKGPPEKIFMTNVCNQYNQCKNISSSNVDGNQENDFTPSRISLKRPKEESPPDNTELRTKN